MSWTEKADVVEQVPISDHQQGIHDDLREWAECAPRTDRERYEW